jgi:tRNA threonylcarbamoyladenosine biosynthesis protein TsaB
MTKILCIETSTEICSVALAYDGKVAHILEDFSGQNHAKLVTVFANQLLEQAGLKFSELDAVAVSEGPGSYTGLRIGVSAAKGICYGASLPLIAVSPLEAMAGAALEKLPQTDAPTWLCPMIDARRMEVYTALFNSKGAQLSPTEAKIIDAESFAEQLAQGEVWFFGNGANKCRPLLASANARFFETNINTSAAHMASVAFAKFNQNCFADVAYFEPFYLKDFMAIKAKNSVLDGLIKQ